MPDAGKLVTFYSFKGGVGRTMALANTAFLLASSGKRVLAVDLDLEAPGLSRYFRPFVSERLLASAPGVIEYLYEQRDVYARAAPSLERRGELREYTLPLAWSFPDGGALDLVTAGRQGPAYARNVGSFDWEDFYARRGGLEILERMKDEMRRNYDYVLIDSRTGISDIAGVCTVQLPDALVACFTPNRQSMEGTARVAESADAQRYQPMATPLCVFPLLMRVEYAELERLEAARDRAAALFSRFLWHLPDGQRNAYWGDVEIPYEPFYAYEEILCAFGGDARRAASIGGSIERFCRYLAGGDVARHPAVPPADQARVREAFFRSPATEEGAASCMISYSEEDRPFAERLRIDLQAASIDCWFAPHDLPIGAQIREGIDDAIRTRDRVLVILSEHSIRSPWVKKEVETAFELEAERGETILVPLRLDAAVLSTGVAWAADIRRQRNIGDFSGGQDGAHYAESLRRLVSSLRR